VIPVPSSCDLLVVGAGINGAGIARDAAGRGLSVVLCDKGDLGGATSSASGKLIHGGLRYLEYLEFRLVREALSERETLMGIAPHITRPMRFVLPHDRSTRPYWLVRLGLFLYDHLGRRRALPGTETVNLARSPLGRTVRPGSDGRAFIYSDVWVDDARLVVLNCLDAAERGATVLPHTAIVAARAADGRWVAALRGADGTEHSVSARAIVNAAGPWVSTVLSGALGANGAKRVRLVKGSHIVVRKWYEGDHAYVLQNDDRRLLFLVPFEGDHLVIGTTDIAYDGRAEDVAIDASESAYLREAVNRRFDISLAESDIVWAFSGVRPLLDDGQDSPSAVTRDYAFDLQVHAGAPPLLSVYGGKITTYRRLAEHAMRELGPHLGARAPDWTGTAPLPGGESTLPAPAWLPQALAARYARTYGARTGRLLGDAHSLDDLGPDLGGGLHVRELEYLRDREWARSADDVLWRRTKLGMRLGASQKRAVQDWFSANPAR